MFIAKLPGVSGVFRIMLLAVMLAVSAGCQLLASNEITAGSVIAFGRYPQTESGEIKPIEWHVMEVKGNMALLLADKGLDAVLYNTKWVDVTWETSFVRQWLNTDFYNAAFNDSEKSRIAIAVLKNPDNPKNGTSGGGDTSDRIFLLSLDEAGRYFMHDAERVLMPTPYAVKRNVWKSEYSGKSYWWLRSPGRYRDAASYVDPTGELDSSGHFVSFNYLAVRPALWIKL